MTINDSPSKNLRAYGREQLFAQIILAAVGLWFCIGAAVLDGPVMNPAVYGPYVTSVKAEVWSWPIFLNSLTYILAIMINGNWRWSPAVRMVAAGAHSVTLFLFAWLSMLTPGAMQYVEPFPAACAIMGVANVWFFFLNAGDTVRAIRCRMN
ncbi:MAG: hypothetical protein R3186_10555 [Ruegeria sp.]|nr:hypothetical protein [Ruegeria sp.]